MRDASRGRRTSSLALTRLLPSERPTQPYALRISKMSEKIVTSLEESNQGCQINSTQEGAGDTHGQFGDPILCLSNTHRRKTPKVRNPISNES